MVKVLKLATNPVLLRAAVVLFCTSLSFLLGLLFIRQLRKNISEEADLSPDAPPSPETLPLHVYNTVIQDLKQQKQELRLQSQAEQQRARVSETFSQAVLSNLSCGVMVFGNNGLVRTANSAAKEILGFASAIGMSAEDIFRVAIVRGSEVHSQNDPRIFPDETPDEPVLLAEEVDAVLRGESKQRQVETEYETPAGEQRFLAVRISPVCAADGNLLGVACLISDLSELESIRRQQAEHGEISAEMALKLRSSLTTIAGYAQQLANSHDSELARQLATDIAEEAVRLDRSIGGFLTERRGAQSGAAGAGSGG
jgi:PAS domain-containing protein